MTKWRTNDPVVILNPENSSLEFDTIKSVGRKFVRLQRSTAKFRVDSGLMESVYYVRQLLTMEEHATRQAALLVENETP